MNGFYDMNLIDRVSQDIANIFEEIGLERELGVLQYSDRPDLSDFQCNGALKAAKILKKNPREIASMIKEKCEKLDMFSAVSVDGPGFLNFQVSDQFLLELLSQLDGASPSGKPEKIIIDYGGPNVAKPLHVGHLRSAIIGESIKRIARSLGHDVVGDIHMGDWGTPMGMLLAELEEMYPNWAYFQTPFMPSEDTKNPPFSSTELNGLYPQAAKHYKEDKNFAQKARQATAQLQDGDEGYKALWQHFLTLSIESIKADFSMLDVDFDIWLGESDADPFIDAMVQDFLDRGIARESEGAIVVDVSRPNDKHDIPPLMLRKSDGASTYATTDLATIFQRVKDYNPDRILYVVDQRQDQHFVQVFRAAAKAGLISEDKLEHVGFGTMNGADGKPFKTRAGGVMRLSDLIALAQEKALQETGFSEGAITDEITKMANAIAIGSIKYGDLKNPRTSDYIFDPNEFVKFEGNTGPYNQYQFVRAGAVLDKALDSKAQIHKDIEMTPYERNLAIKLIGFAEAKEKSFKRKLPSDLCDYMHDLSRAFSAFYKNCPIATAEDTALRETRVQLTGLTHETLRETMDLLAIPRPEKMIRNNVMG
ncbi:MAG: arginine--tRNA ligase [Alphaproteobacteria bacterium]|nr:MAG: arginine--tRNA ligase [Alphaproteobacteria bacterium]